jgi:hypothetical protein
MATEKAASTSKPTTDAPVNGDASALPPPAAEPSSGWAKVASDRMVYKPEQCHTHPVQGLLLGRQELPGDPPWAAFIIRLTQPTIAVDRNDKVIAIAAGEEIYLPETNRLEGLRRAAANPGEVFEVWVKPHEKIKLGGGRELWIYKVQVNKKSQPRTGDMKMFVGGQQPAQLGMGDAAGAGADAPPFN